VDVYEYDDGEGGRSPARTLVILVAIAAVAAVGWFVVKPRLGGDDNNAQPAVTVPTTAVGASASTTGVDDSTPRPTERASTTTAAASSDGASSTTVAGAGAAAGTTAAATETTVPAGAETTTTPPAETVAPAETTTAPAETTAPTTAAATTVPAVAAPYPTLPDGNPVPVVVTFDVGRTVLTGQITDEAMSLQLADLALAYSRDPANTVIDNQLVLNPAVPRNVGVRVLELTSTRFPEASAEVLLPHAAELNRVIAAMNAFPNVSVLIVGHADQRGNDLANYALSEARADAVYNYFVSQGIRPDRLSARAVGEADLLSINDDAASLALNRRTEFIFYGLLNQ
jgi:outer membrane protein OmpA-like peptidoglycan-associated protein